MFDGQLCRAFGRVNVQIGRLYTVDQSKDDFLRQKPDVDRLKHRFFVYQTLNAIFDFVERHLKTNVIKTKGRIDEPLRNYRFASKHA
jgi:hypothetical protein